MRILIDECVDPRIKRLLDGHEATTVHDHGWDSLEDGPLLAVAQNRF
jgi:predicted nuclease of predicted toxin-antitoxin system